MGKKKRANKTTASRQISAITKSDLKLNTQLAGVIGQAKRPRILFAVGDADDAYTESKIWRLMQRLQGQTGYEVIGVTTDQETAKSGEKLGLQVQIVSINPQGVSAEERVWAASELIRETADLRVPGSDLFLWKVLALDDFVGSLLLFGAQPTVAVEADLVILPLMSMDNNSRDACGLYTWLTAQAQQKGIPVIGLEVSPLGNKTTLSHLPATHYAVKTPWARNFLIRRGIAAPSQVSVLRWEETYMLWPGQDEYTEAYLDKEAKAREMLKTPPDRFIVVITHHVNLLWEVRETLAALAQAPGPLSVVIRVNPATVRRQYYERDMVLKAYVNELRALPHVMIDEQVGVGLLLQLADLVISPFAGTTTERASLCRKPTIICQSMGEEGWQGESVYWEPHPRRIPEIIQAWREQGILGRASLAQLARAALRDEMQIAA